MKHLFLALTFCLGLLSFSQSPGDGWILGAGINTVNNLGIESPYNSPDEWAFKNPFSVGAEVTLDNRFSLDMNLSFNGYDKGDNINGSAVEKSYDYVGFDTSAKYYFGDILFDDYSPFHLYAMAGPGFYFIDENNVSFNLGGGLLVWLNKNRSFGVRLQSMAKFALGKNDIHANNHFQHHLQMVFHL